MSQFAADSTVSPAYWQRESQNGNPAVAPAGVDAYSAVATAGGFADAESNLSAGDFAALPQQWVGRPRGRTVVRPCPVWKRVMDIAGAVAALAILSPFFLAIGLYIKCASRGPVLFRQQRFGLGGQAFKVWKFRTIEVSDAPVHHRSHVSDLMANDRTLEKCDDQLEVIRGGGLLRRLGIDELPQLMNVLIGEMSLVGPRPDVVPICDYAQWQRRRFDVLPGITGLWQVSGKNRTTFSTMMRLDAAYVRCRSFWFDVSILLRTIPSILFG